ncbi:hypothetical protein Ddc_19250 [Ditylenchus destructor]|nr:hypothetical protein Ddc_19250 [Ditylenchus destructor]
MISPRFLLLAFLVPHFGRGAAPRATGTAQRHPLNMLGGGVKSGKLWLAFEWAPLPTRPEGLCQSEPRI